MKDYERITGEKIFELIKQLQEDRTVLNINLLGRDYERLTNVIGSRNENGILYLLIDYPRGFKEAVADVEVWKTRFEFTGRGKVPYIFKTSGGEISGDGVWIKFPEVIERVQRRKYFRLGTPLGTRINALINSNNYELIVVNISQGGAFVSLKGGDQKKANLEMGYHLKHFAISFPSKKEDLKVNIKEALVKSVEKDLLTDRYYCRLQFSEIEKDEENALRALIFRFQREFLRKR